MTSDADNEYMMILCALIHAAPALQKKDGGQAIGRSRRGLTTKIHAIVDALGNPANLMLRAGQIQDLACAQNLTENADPQALIVDNPLINSLTEREITPVIPPNPIERPNTIAISHFSASATSSSASSIRLNAWAITPLRPATTNSLKKFFAAVQLVSAIIFSTEEQALGLKPN